MSSSHKKISGIVDFLDRKDALVDPPEGTQIGALEEADEIWEVDCDELWGGRELSPDSPWDGDTESHWDVGDIDEYLGDLSEIINGGSSIGEESISGIDVEEIQWDIDAWYAPYHYNGYGGGIYIRQSGLIKLIYKIARYFSRHSGAMKGHRPRAIFLWLRRLAFNTFFLHEHFHHKVESYGLKLHAITGHSSYLPYDDKIFWPNFKTTDCLEEALANADIYQRISTKPYNKDLPGNWVSIYKSFLEDLFYRSSYGYGESVHYLRGGDFSDGIKTLQSQIVECTLKPKRLNSDWDVAPQMTRSLLNFKTDVWVVVPRGSRSVLPSKGRKVISCLKSELIKVMERDGYTKKGGKGSHIKMSKPGRDRPIIISGHGKKLREDIVRSILKSAGGYKIQDLTDILSGKIALV